MQAAAENGQDETQLAKGPKRKKRAWEEDLDEGPDSEEERERQRAEDQRAKEEFEQRLRDRDEAKTKKLMEAKLSQEEIEVRPASSSAMTSSPGAGGCSTPSWSLNFTEPSLSRHAGISIREY